MSGNSPGTGAQNPVVPTDGSMGKTDLRRRLLAMRREMPPPERRRAQDALSGLVARLAAQVSASDAITITAYVPARTEPGAVATLEALVARHVRVLLPVIDPVGPAPLRWAEFRSVADLTPGPFGILQPIGTVLPTDAAHEALWMAIPALAVDRTGVRLGRGGGHYDRTLAALNRTHRIVAVVNDHEVVYHLPAEPHDIRVTHILTPTAGPARTSTAGPAGTTTARPVRVESEDHPSGRE